MSGGILRNPPPGSHLGMPLSTTSPKREHRGWYQDAADPWMTAAPLGDSSTPGSSPAPRGEVTPQEMLAECTLGAPGCSAEPCIFPRKLLKGKGWGKKPKGINKYGLNGMCCAQAQPAINSRSR